MNDSISSAWHEGDGSCGSFHFGLQLVSIVGPGVSHRPFDGNPHLPLFRPFTLTTLLFSFDLSMLTSLLYSARNSFSSTSGCQFPLSANTTAVFCYLSFFQPSAKTLFFRFYGLHFKFMVWIMQLLFFFFFFWQITCTEGINYTSHHSD